MQQKVSREPNFAVFSREAENVVSGLTTENHPANL